MIEDIEITNFRCFDRLKVSGCKKINLISGKNNVGKTALLEAIFLDVTPTKDTVFLLCDLRGKYGESWGISPEKTWSYLLFQQNIDSKCSIKSIFDDQSSKIVEMYIRNRITLLNEDYPQSWRYQLDQLYKDSAEFILLLDTKIDRRDSYQTIIISKDRQISGATTPDTDFNTKYLQSSSFMPSSKISSSVSITVEFDRARLNEREDEVLKAFQIIDSSIIAVESFSIPEPTIYLKRQGEKRLPLSLFGDAMNRIADIILKIINNQDSILLIDEIENGIHHSNQIAFWDFLYRLAEQLNVQIFATTHSLEMTEAFIKAGLDRQDSAAHFELVRHEKTNKIVAINRDLETLEYGISHHKEVRGGA
jgi:AAA15 family ATPase/GTPase